MTFLSLKAWRTLLGIAICLWASLSSAQSSNALSDVVITATRQERRASDAITDIITIGPKEIQNSGQSSLAELLGRQPGIEFKSNGGLGAPTDLFIRGTNSGHVLLLVDGIRVGSATTGAPTWSYIPLEHIDHIEILKGAASSLYGSDAIGGVVQIFTKRGDGPPQSFAQTGYGSYNTKSAAAGVSGGADGWRYSAQVGDKTSDSFAPASPANSSFDPTQRGFRYSNLSGQLSYEITNGQEVGVNYLYSQGWNRFNYYIVGPEYKNYQTVSLVGAFAKSRISDVWVSKVQISQSVDDNLSYQSNALLFNYRTAQDQFLWQNDVELASGLALFGVEKLNQRVGSQDSPYLVTSRSINSVFAGWVKKFDLHHFQFNLRNDQNSQYGQKSTGLMGYGYHITPFWQIKTSIGTGFKAPTFNDLYYPFDGYQRGNPALLPETSLNRELALYRELENGQMSLTHYQNDVKNLIQWAPDSNWIWTSQNVASARLSGWTATIKSGSGGLHYSASLDLLDPKDNTLQKTLYYRARETLKINLDKDFAALNLGAEWMVTGRRFTDADNTQTLGGYGLFNVYGNYKISKDTTATFRVNNALDKKYILSQGYATPGRNWFAGLRFNLN
jgi:vitamin B12 transporter